MSSVAPLALRAALVILSLVTVFNHAWWATLTGGVPPIQTYFALAAVLFLVGAILVSVKGSGTLFRTGAVGLLLLGVIDNALIVYTKIFPAPVINVVFPWSTDWIPPGSVQTFIVQIFIIVVSGLALLRVRQTKTTTTTPVRAPEKA